VVVADGYDQGRLPGELAGTRWAAEVTRVLAPDGLLLVNASDQPGLRWVRRLTATLRTQLPHVGLLVLREVTKGRRFGNVVVVASPRPLDDVSLTRVAARATFPSEWLDAGRTARAERGA